MSKAIVSLCFSFSLVYLTLCLSPAAGAQTGQDVATLLAQIKSGSPTVRQSAQAALMQLDAGATPALIAALKDPDATVRADAAAALGEIGPEANAAVPALTEALQDKSSGVQEAAAGALGDIGPSAAPAIPALVFILHDSDRHLKSVVEDALAGIGPAAIPALMTMTKLNPEASFESETAGKVLQKLGMIAVPALIAALNDPNQQMRDTASTVLQGIGADALPGLFSALSSPSNQTRQQIVVTLGGFGTSQSLIAPVLEKTLTDPVSAMRLSAIDSLDRIRTDLDKTTQDAIASQLVSALADPDISVREGAARCLPDFGPATPAVQSALLAATKDADGQVRGAAFVSLGETAPQTPGLVPLLIDGLKDPSDAARSGSAEGLSQIGGKAIPSLIVAAQDQNPQIRLLAITALGNIDDKQGRGVSVLIGALTDQSQAVSQAATRAFRSAGQAAVSPLVTALADKDPLRRAGAARALGLLGDTAKPAVPALKKASQDRVASVRLSAVEALQRVQNANDMMAAAIIAVFPFGVYHRPPSPNDTLPHFPWPPPQPTLTLTLTRQHIAKDTDALDKVREHLKAVLNAAGYSDQSLMAAPGGFAVITRVEQIHPDGAYLPDPYRFGLAPPPITGSFLPWMRQYLHRLFSRNDQQFRMFVMVVTPYDINGSGQPLDFTEAQKWLRMGGQTLPRSIGRMTFKGRNCYLLVYDFAFVRSEDSPDLVLSPLSAMTHCIKAGILTALGGQP